VGQQVADVPINSLPLSADDDKRAHEYERLAVYDYPTAQRFFVSFQASVAADMRLLVAEQLTTIFPSVLCTLTAFYFA
jgi:hypothetical protein